MQISRLKDCKLKIATIGKNPNGTKGETYSLVNKYKIEIKELNDDISATIYGANINNMLRIKSVLNKLEKDLKPKVNNKSDNVSKYFIYVNNKQYKINSVRENYIDIEDTGITE